MRTLSGWKHWLTMGLALLVSAGQGYGQSATPTKPAQFGSKSNSAKPVRTAGYSMLQRGGVGMDLGVMPTGYMMGEGPSSMAIPGPAPMELQMTNGSGTCDAGCCDSCGPGSANGLFAACGPNGCGPFGGGLNGYGPCGCGNDGCNGLGCGLLGGLGQGSGCGFCSGNGCLGCGWNQGTLLPGGLLCRLLGPLAPYSEGPAAQRWFDISAGTIALARTNDFADTILSSTGVAGTNALSTNDTDLEKLRFGLALTLAVQVGPASNLEVSYFGLNRWNSVVTATGNANLYSIYSAFGTSPAGGFDDTDRSNRHTLSYSSELHNGEVNFRRRWVGPAAFMQGSLLAGIRHFDLDEHLNFNAIGENNNGAGNNGLRFFEHSVKTRNQLTGFQVGGDAWINVIPGLYLGTQNKIGVFGNHAESEATIVANSIALGREFIQDGRTAFLNDFSVSTVYRLTYSWALNAGYNILYVDNVAIAPENFNTRDVSNLVGSGSFTSARQGFIDTDGEVYYQGVSFGAEYMW